MLEWLELREPYCSKSDRQTCTRHHPTGGTTIEPQDVKSVQICRFVWSVALLALSITFLLNHGQDGRSRAFLKNEAIQRDAAGSTAWLLSVQVVVRCRCGSDLARRIGSAKDNVGPADRVSGMRPFLIGCLRKRSSSDASLLLRSDRGSGSGMSQPAAASVREGGKSRWQEQEWGGAKEARRGEAEEQGQEQDSTRPSVLFPQPSQSLLSVCPS